MWIRTAFMGSAEMLAEEIVRARVGKVGVGLVVVLAALARKGVIHLRINVDGDERIALEAIQDRRAGFGRCLRCCRSCRGIC